MCIIFKTNGNVTEYVAKGYEYPFPKAPTLMCKKCKRVLRFKKHGFRKRWYVSKGFIGRIIIRRYICPCKRFTISMIPDFCLRRYTTSFEHIFEYVYRIILSKKKLKEILKELNNENGPLKISRQQGYFYRKRFLKNIKFLEIGIRSLNSEIKLPKEELSDIERARGIMEIVKKEFNQLNDFSQKFQEVTNNTPIALIK